MSKHSQEIADSIEMQNQSAVIDAKVDWSLEKLEMTQMKIMQNISDAIPGARVLSGQDLFYHCICRDLWVFIGCSENSNLS